MTIQYLKGLTSNVGHRTGAFVERQPIVYAPSSTAEVNQALLPPPEAMRDMELAYREEQYAPGELESATGRIMSRMLLASLAASLVLGAGGVVLRPEWVPMLAGLGSLVLALDALTNRTVTTGRLIAYLTLPGLILYVVIFFGQVLQHRFVAVCVAAIAALAVAFVHGKKPFQFYRDWAYAHPILKPEERARPKAIPLGPSWPVLAAILAIAVVVPELSNALAVLSILGVSIATVRERPGRVFERVCRVLGQYVTYGGRSSGAPGVWCPAESLEVRRAVAFGISFVPILTLTIGLQMFAPWDILERAVADAFGEGALAHAKRSTHGWVLIAVQGILNAQVSFLWLFPVSILLALVTSFYAFAAIFHRPLVAAERLQQEIESRSDERTEAEWYWDRIRLSDHVAENPLGEDVRESEHLFLGVEPNRQFPILLHMDAFRGHMYITGQTGTGKTALGLTQLLVQVLRGHKTKTRSVSEAPPIVVLDLKGDPALFQALRREAEERRKAEGITDPEDPRYAFKYFSPEKGSSSFYFNPFQSLDSELRTDVQLTDLLIDCLGLFHGEGYGRSYFSRRSRLLLYKAIHNPKGKRIKSFEELNARILELAKDEKVAHDTFELLAAVHAISRYEKVATATNLDDASRAINMHDVLEHRQVVVFWLPAVVESASVRELGKLALFCHLAAAIDRKRLGKGSRESLLVVDEFQRIAGENFKVVLEQAREFDVSAILANQTQGDLKLHDVDLRPTVRTNTRVKMFFGVTDPDEMHDLIRTSGEEIAHIQTETMGVTTSAKGGSESQSSALSQALKPRISQNDVHAITDHPLEFVLHVARGAGCTQFAGLPHRVRTTYPVPYDVYTKRKERGGPPREPQSPDESMNERGPKEHDEDAAAFLESKLAEFLKRQKS